MTDSAYSVSRIALLLLVLLGLTDSLYLSYTHYLNFTDISFVSFCALSNTINCDTVAQSPWSIFAGLPVAYWGVAGYSLLLSFLLAAPFKEKNTNIFSLVFPVSLIYSCISIYLFYVSKTKINAFCILCLASYLINFIITYISGRLFFTQKNTSLSGYLQSGMREIFQNKSVQYTTSALFFTIVLCWAFLPRYWMFNFPPVTNMTNTGFTEDGSPWIGAKDPLITIEEYTDYQCFQCGKLHLLLRKLIEKHPDTIRLVHHHYPLDHEYNEIVVPEPFHVGSGKLSLLAIYAAYKGKFWLMNDKLYKIMRTKRDEEINLSVLAGQTNFNVIALSNALSFDPFIKKLLYDIRKGMRLEITGTPTYVINGKVHQGSIPKELPGLLKSAQKTE